MRKVILLLIFTLIGGTQLVAADSLLHEKENLAPLHRNLVFKDSSEPVIDYYLKEMPAEQIIRDR